MSISTDLRNAGLSVATGRPSGAADGAGNARLDVKHSDTPSRIVEAAERLFRRFGVHKTTVTDIARALSMSPANIYRFFDSKHAINEAVCRRLLGELISVAAELAQRNVSAEERLRAVLHEVARRNVERFRTDEKLHQLLAVATSENWPVIIDHLGRMESILAAIVADGIWRGEFPYRDARRAGRCVQAGMMRHLHPTAIVECGAAKRPMLDEMVDFCLAALHSPQLAEELR
jgi:AcrR family transcriptional regulator